MGDKFGLDENAVKQQGVLRHTLLSRLLDSVKQFQSHFGCQKELATDGDVRLTCLLAQLEAVLYHGLKRDASSYTPLRHVTDIVSKFAGDAFNSDANLWPCISCMLTEEERNRLTKLKHINTPSGRVKAWLRASLNEKSLFRYFEILLGDKELLNRFYEPWAFIRDPESNATLPQIAQGLSTILFAISIDNNELNSARGVPEDTSSTLMEANKAPQPIMALQTSANRRLSSFPNAKKKRKPLVNVVSFEDGDTRFNESEGKMTLIPSPDIQADPTSMNALINVWNKHSTGTLTLDNEPGPLIESYDSDATVSSCPSDKITHGPTKTSTSFAESIREDSPPPVHSNPPNGLRLDSSDEVFLPVSPNDQSILGDTHNIGETDNSDKMNCFLADVESSMESSLSSLSINPVQSELDLLRKEKEDCEVYYRSILNETKKENEMLKCQLKSYVEAVRILKEAKNGSNSNVNSNSEEEGFEANSSDQYEHKLIQVAEMHAELSEFNSHLVLQLTRLKSKVKRYRDELVALRGELPGDFDFDEADSSRTQVPINIWIPSAFLTGKGTDVHHVYQVYVRVGSTEFNVYKRYKDFKSFHDLFRKKDPVIAGLAFPPKKKIGKKEKKFVEERRKSLEEFLRKAVNHIVFTFPEFQAVPTDRRSLSTHIPLFRDA